VGSKQAQGVNTVGSTKMTALKLRIEHELEQLRKGEINSAVIDKIGKDLDRESKRLLASVPSASLVAWGLGFLRFGFDQDLISDVFSAHLTALFASAAVVVGLKYALPMKLGSSKEGKYAAAIRLARGRHFDWAQAVTAHILFEELKNQALLLEGKTLTPDRVKALYAAIGNLKQRWSEVDPYASDALDDEMPLLALSGLSDKLLSEAETVDGVWVATYGISLSSLVRLIDSIEDYYRQVEDKEPHLFAVFRLQYEAIKRICRIEETELKRALQMLTLDRVNLTKVAETNKAKFGWLMRYPLVKYSDEESYITCRLMLYWAKEVIVESTIFDPNIAKTTKEKGMTKELDKLIKKHEFLLLEAYSGLFKKAGFEKVFLNKTLPKVGECDLIALNPVRGILVLGELKRRSQKFMDTSNFIRDAEYIEEVPVAQLKKKTEYWQDRCVQKALRSLFGNNAASQLVPVVILDMLPMPYAGDLPVITPYNNASTLKSKIDSYLRKIVS
jgi:Holliday junction resolvase-like predicted endonuclease